MSDLPSQPPGWTGPWLAAMLRQARDYAIMLTDREGRLVAWFTGAEHLFGYTRQEAVGQPIALIFTDEDRASRQPEHELLLAQAAGQAQDDRWHVRKDGSRFWATGVTLAIRSPEGELLGFGKMLRDRTDLRTQIETLKNNLREHARARQAQDAFLGVLGHELRNPLMPLKAAATIVRRLAGESAPLARPLQIIDRQIDALQRLLDDLMDMARSHSGKLHLLPRRICLQDELAQALEAAASRAEAAGIELRSILPEVPLMMDLDSDRFQQVMANLLNNAIKHSTRGATVWLKANLEPGHAVVRVEDSGEGIAPELQPKIFDLFTQGPDAESGRGSGLGIGLALVKELVSLHHGTVAVRSEGPGKGAEFTVRLPLSQPPPHGSLAREEGGGT